MSKWFDKTARSSRARYWADPARESERYAYMVWLAQIGWGALAIALFGMLLTMN